jgi:hypothetical protein
MFSPAGTLDVVMDVVTGKTVRVGALPTFIVIGAMKCGTSALHCYLALHPKIAMSNPKELCFFFHAPSTAPPQMIMNDDGGWSPGNWHRGVDWYASHFPPETPARGESSPGYTSPSNPHVAERIAALIPQVKLIYLVRDPVDRAASQYLHHRREGTETRAIDAAVFDPHSQFMSRSRYHERLRPFLNHFTLDRIAIVAQEELATRLRPTLSFLFDFVGVDHRHWSRALDTLPQRPSMARVKLEKGDRSRLADLLRPDADNLCRLAGRKFPSWSI